LRACDGDQVGVDAFGERDDRGRRAGNARLEFGSVRRRFTAHPQRHIE
jgi:hypothetical protein